MPKGYNRTQISLHWVLFIIIIAQFVFHEGIADAWEKMSKGAEVAFSPLVAAHVFGGLLALVLVLWRISVRLKRGAPELPAEDSGITKLAAKGTHLGLYALMILMPISGAVAWFGGVEAAANGHAVMKFAMIALVTLHVVAALYHQYMLKNGLLKRMMKADQD